MYYSLSCSCGNNPVHKTQGKRMNLIHRGFSPFIVSWLRSRNSILEKYERAKLYNNSLKPSSRKRESSRRILWEECSLLGHIPATDLFQSSHSTFSYELIDRSRMSTVFPWLSYLPKDPPLKTYHFAGHFRFIFDLSQMVEKR